MRTPYSAQNALSKQTHPSLSTCLSPTDTKYCQTVESISSNKIKTVVEAKEKTSLDQTITKSNLGCRATESKQNHTSYKKDKLLKVVISCELMISRPTLKALLIYRSSKAITITDIFIN